MTSVRLKWSHAGSFILFAGLFAAQAADLDFDASAPPQSSGSQSGGSPSGGTSAHHIGIAADVSILLGVGVQGAVELTPKTNVRGGFNFFDYSLTETKSGFSVDGKLHLRSAEALYDWYPRGGAFHLSPGALVYNGNTVTANLTTTSGATFKLNGTTYSSSSVNPVTGQATVDLNDYKVAPMFLLGWGNLAPRSGRHFGVNFDIGAAFTGSPKVALNLAGTACSPSGGCVNAATDPTLQSNIQSTQTKANNAISVLKAFPVMSIAFGYSF